MKEKIQYERKDKEAIEIRKAFDRTIVKLVNSSNKLDRHSEFYKDNLKKISAKLDQTRSCKRMVNRVLGRFQGGHF